MAITLIAGIKQANNGTFALVDSNDIHGGLYHTDTLAEMQEIPLERIKDGMLCYVSEVKTYYRCEATLENKKVVSANWVEFTIGSGNNNNNNEGSNPTPENPDPENPTPDNPDPDNPVPDNPVPEPEPEDENISHIFVSDVPPFDLDLFWFDTTDEDEEDEEVDENGYTLSDAKADIEGLMAIISSLESRIKYLEENGVVGPGGGTPGVTNGSAVLLENGEGILLENGEELLLESFVSDNEIEDV